MKLISKSLLVVAALSLAACSGGPFGGGAGVGGPGAGGPGAGQPAPGSVAFFQQNVGDRVLFAVDESTLNIEARSILSAQAQFLMGNPEYSAIVEGHADEQGTREYNLALGARRAAAVRDFLVAQGVADARLRTVTYGKERPLEICSEEACYAKNRRAVTVLQTASGA
ncbi:MAG: peptidoglycan-associated lipoprotein Pal [Brevirhabdus sp.]